MGDEKAQRLDDALSSLVDILIPALPEEDEAAADERHDDALELARSIIDKCVACGSAHGHGLTFAVATAVLRLSQTSIMPPS